jgi:hypothetical protein
VPFWRRQVYHLVVLGGVALAVALLNQLGNGQIGSDWALSYGIVALCFLYPRRMLAMGWVGTAAVGLVTVGLAFGAYSALNYYGLLAHPTPNASGFAGYWGYAWVYMLVWALQEAIAVLVPRAHSPRT